MTDRNQEKRKSTIHDQETTILTNYFFFPVASNFADEQHTVWFHLQLDDPLQKNKIVELSSLSLWFD